MILLGVVFIVSCGNNQTKFENQNIENDVLDVNGIRVQTLMKNIRDSAVVDTNFFITDNGVSFTAIYLKGDSIVKLYVDELRITQELRTKDKDHSYTMSESEKKGFFLFPFWKQFE